MLLLPACADLTAYLRRLDVCVLDAVTLVAHDQPKASVLQYRHLLTELID